MGEQPLIKKEDIFNKLEEIKKFVSHHTTNLPNTVWEAMDGFSKTFLAFRDKGGAANWATDLKNADGNPLWTEKQVKMLEELLSKVVEKQQERQQERQHGGGPNSEKVPQLQSSPSVTPITPPDLSWVSLDKAYYDARSVLEGLDKNNKEMARSIGALVIVNSYEKKGEDVMLVPKTPPYLPVDIRVPPRIILPLLNTVIEAIRLLVTVTFDNQLLRQLFSLSLALLDVARGEWKDGILSFLGVFGKDWMFMGIVGKTARWIYNFMSPNIQENLEENLFQGGKSIFAGFWLWLGSVTSPALVRSQINELIAKGNSTVEEINKKIDKVEEVSQKEAAKAGMKVTFPRVPLDKMPSFDDIQNFQIIIQQPAVFCNPSFQTILKPALAIPPLRVFLEMLNVPTIDEKIAEYCKNVPQNLEGAVAKELKPTIQPLSETENPETKEPETKEPETKAPNQKGGKSKKKRAKKKKRGTRKRSI